MSRWTSVLNSPASACIISGDYRRSVLNRQQRLPDLIRFSRNPEWRSGFLPLLSFEEFIILLKQFVSTYKLLRQNGI
ncbi:hypothetical protein SUGI_1010200 [Cryptomeria japonica]|nr:hypothetical protein SUGI_1010200 [Cryptomeria japonica]